MAKPKKGVMPAALKRYWATHRRGKKKPLRVLHKAIKRVTAKRKRKVNPRSMFKIIAKKANHTLTFNGLKFSSNVRSPATFATTSAAAEVAKGFLRQHTTMRTYAVYVVPHRKY